jgi:uncharacterized protein (TIGR03083 family)
MTDQPDQRLTKAELRTHIDEAWSALQAFIGTLTPHDMTEPTDAAGWTVKDHLFHLAAWESSLIALLERRSRGDEMGVSPEAWASRDIDRMNEDIRQRHAAQSADEAVARLRDVHARFLAKLDDAALTDDDLYQPYNSYQPESPRTDPIIGWLKGDTYEHYAEHIPWMTAIVKSRPS